MRSIKIGTRGSELALTQARMVESRILELYPDIEIETVIIKTLGDKEQNAPLREIGHDKGAFVSELENALTRSQIDLAVHSMKDVPSSLSPTLPIAAILARANVTDQLIVKTDKINGATNWQNALNNLPNNFSVGTSSLRRQCLLRNLRNDVIFSELRGNVPTRLRKLSDSDELDAIILASAGLVRLEIKPSDFPEFSFFELPKDKFIPCGGQAAVGIQTRSDNAELIRILQKINHEKTFIEVSIEREILSRIGAHCHTPVGIHAEKIDNKLLVNSIHFKNAESHNLIQAKTFAGSYQLSQINDLISNAQEKLVY